jgi:hypothetical protein
MHLCNVSLTDQHQTHITFLLKHFCARSSLCKMAPKKKKNVFNKFVLELNFATNNGIGTTKLSKNPTLMLSYLLPGPGDLDCSGDCLRDPCRRLPQHHSNSDPNSNCRLNSGQHHLPRRLHLQLQSTNRKCRKVAILNTDWKLELF